MPRTLNRLSTLKVTQAKQPGMYADGGGLYLRVASGGSKQWVFRYSVNGRLRDMGVGPVHTFTLAEARERAREARKLRQDGIDPITQKHARAAALRIADANAMTFKQCAEAFIKDHAAAWTNPKHRFEWESSLFRHVYPTLATLPIAVIDTPLILRVLKPIWTTIPQTASRIRGRIERVIDWATAHHYRSGDNPARWDGRLEHALPAIAKIRKVEHFAALPYPEIGGFMAALSRQ